MRYSRVFSLLTVAGLLLGMMIATAGASSHREAPLIANDPQADNTDVWAFVDPATPGYLNIIAAYYPFEMPAGFPNGYTFGDEILYTIRIDNTGDGKADKSYGFQFRTEIRNPNTFYSNVTLADDLKITSPDDPDLNIVQTYDVAITDGRSLPVPRGRNTVAQGLFTSPNNVGPNSTPNFQDTMLMAVEDLPDGSKVWAGQADDPFFADLGAIWDLAQLRTITGDNGGIGIDALADFNAQVIALQVPIGEVTASGAVVTDSADPNAVIGIWAANYRPSTRVILPAGHKADDTLDARSFELHAGRQTQVSRLGMPLSNEFIILLEDKDLWIRSRPRDDEQFVDYYLNSHLAVLLNALFGTPGATTNRQDLVAIFLTGIPGLTQIGDQPALADMLRINLAAPSGFPNGRLLTDDVVDVSLSVVGLSDGTLEGIQTSGISDGVDANDREFMDVFPYVAVPHSGYEFNPDADDD